MPCRAWTDGGVRACVGFVARVLVRGAVLRGVRLFARWFGCLLQRMQLSAARLARPAWSAAVGPAWSTRLPFLGHGDEERDGRKARRARSVFMPRLRREYHMTVARDNQVVVYGLGACAALVAGGYVLDALDEMKKAKASQPDITPESSGGKNFYKGGFEPKMNKREAARILGVRESASKERIKEAHRRILMLNHPDTGGSNYVATKINEAKELLLGGSGTGGGSGD